MELPEGLEKFLKSLGVNTSRLKWKLLELERWWKRQKARFQKVEGKKKYKHCRCGKLYLAEDKTCNFCGRKLPSYTMYRISRLFAIEKPDFGIVSTAFLFLIVILYGFQLALFGLSGLMYPSNQALVRFGALTGELFLNGDFFRIFTMALVHIGIVHILFNAIAISHVLPHFEQEIGPWATLVLITATQLIAGIAHLVFYPPFIITGGASGIAFGLIGFGVAYFRRARRPHESRFFFRWFIYALVFGFMFHANHAAHIGGFLAGLPLGHLMAGRSRTPLMRKTWKVLGTLCLVLWIISILFLIAQIPAGNTPID